MATILTQARGKLRAVQENLKKLREEAEAARAEMAQNSAIPEVEKILPPPAPGEKTTRVELGVGTIVKTVFLALLVFYLSQTFFEIGKILLTVFIAVIISAALDPITDRWEKRRIPRSLTVLGFYAVFLGAVGILVSSALPSIAAQILSLAAMVSAKATAITPEQVLSWPGGEFLLPAIRDGLANFQTADLAAEIQKYLQEIYASLSTLTGGVFEVLGTVFGGVFTILLALVLAFYMTVEDNSIEKFLANLTPRAHRGYVLGLFEQIKKKMGAWLRSQIMISAIVGLTVWIGLSIIGVEFAGAAGFLAALTEFIPVIGPIVAGVPVTLLAFVHGPFVALATGIFFVILNSIESNILVPLIMKHAVGLSPLVVVLAMMIGQALIGVPGIILSIPFAAMIAIFLADYAGRESREKPPTVMVEKI